MQLSLGKLGVEYGMWDFQRGGLLFVGYAAAVLRGALSLRHVLHGNLVGTVACCSGFSAK